jgi:RimJ/RimL family protein N-acetyltransferase
MEIFVIRLEKFTENDFDNLISWITTEEDLIQFAGTIFSYPLSKEQLHKYIENPNVNAFKVLYDGESAPIGHAEIFLPNNNVPRLCRILIGNKNYRGKGLGEQIVRELLKICFDKFNSDRVELNVYDWNASAIKTYEKVGFKVNPENKRIILVNSKSWTSVNMFIENNHFRESNEHHK